jgi:hypothetical protein
MEPVDSSALAVFRIGVGSLIAWEVWREFEGGLLRLDYIDPDFHFGWAFLEWVRPLSPGWTNAIFALLAASALCVALGLFYRAAVIVTLAGVSYWFLLEKARYLNHRYLALLFAFLLILVPAHTAFSLDARRKPWLRSRTVPAWPLWLLRVQVGVPYFFAGVAKLNYDWMVRAEPLSTWLADQTSFPLIGRFFTDEVFVRFLAYGSMFLDLTVPFFLLHRRTRVPAYALALAFHFMNSRLFDIGIFPWLMIVATTVFFDADWPRRMSATIRRGGCLARAAVLSGFALGFLIGGFLPPTFSGVRGVFGGFGVAFFAFQLLPGRLTVGVAGDHAPESPWRRFGFSRPLAWLLVAWVAVQVLVPVRHFLIPGDVAWTQEGTRFSWHLLLRSTTGSVVFLVTDPVTGQTGRAVPEEHLTRLQIGKMASSPDMILQFAHYLEEFYKDTGGYEDLEVRAEAFLSLNFRDPQRWIDNKVDLTKIRRPYIPPARWILPMGAER